MKPDDEGPGALVARFLSETAENGELDRQLRPLIARWPRLTDTGELRQLVVTRAWELRERFRGNTSSDFLAWTRGLAWRVALELWKSQGRRQRLYERLRHVLPKVGASAENQVQTHDLVRWLLAGLTDRERKLLNLKYFRGLSISEAAAAMEMTPEAFSQLHHRAMLKLRKKSEGSETDR
jgi:RNA polymerase sigma factor (sigma-70 family)